MPFEGSTVTETELIPADLAYGCCPVDPESERAGVILQAASSGLRLPSNHRHMSLAVSLRLNYSSRRSSAAYGGPKASSCSLLEVYTEEENASKGANFHIDLR